MEVSLACLCCYFLRRVVTLAVTLGGEANTIDIHVTAYERVLSTCT